LYLQERNKENNINNVNNNKISRQAGRQGRAGRQAGTERQVNKAAESTNVTYFTPA
jgi:hypothetical protein